MAVQKTDLGLISKAHLFMYFLAYEKCKFLHCGNQTKYDLLPLVVKLHSLIPFVKGSAKVK